MSFETFLEEKFTEQYTGNRGDWETALDNWMSQLDVQELIDYAEEWKKI